MSMKHEIQNAFDTIHAPEGFAERMKQELYQKDFHESGEEMVFHVTEAPKRSFGRYVAFSAALLVMCVGGGLSIWKLNTQVDPMNPQTYVVSSVDDTVEETTEMPVG